MLLTRTPLASTEGVPRECDFTVVKIECATSCREARQFQCPKVQYQNQELRAVPKDVARIRTIQDLDLSQNEIQEFVAADLPACLNQLNLAGNALAVLPELGPHLQHLTTLNLSANALTDAAAVFKCPALIHANLAYNRLATIQSDPASDLMSLDVSHNHLCSVVELAEALRPLHNLRNLSVIGNPFCMHSSYTRKLLSNLPHLVYIDGKAVEDLVGGGKRKTQTPGGVPSATVDWAASVNIHLKVFNLAIAEDQEQDIAPPPANPGTPMPPPRPTLFYALFTDFEGTQMSTTPLRVNKEPPPEIEAKGQPDKVAKNKGKKDADTPVAPDMPAGCLEHTFSIPTSVEGRDWLLNRLEISLFKVEYRGTQQPYTAQELAKMNDPKAKKKPEPPEPRWDWEMLETALGKGRCNGMQPLIGVTKTHQDRCTFLKEGPLFDDQDKLIPLSTQTPRKTGRCLVTVEILETL